MTESQAEQWAKKLATQLVKDSPEDIIGGLARLVLMKEEFKDERLYRSILRTMAAALLAKVV